MNKTDARYLAHRMAAEWAKDLCFDLKKGERRMAWADGTPFSPEDTARLSEALLQIAVDQRDVGTRSDTAKRSMLKLDEKHGGYPQPTHQWQQGRQGIDTCKRCGMQRRLRRAAYAGWEVLTDDGWQQVETFAECRSTG